MGTDTPTYDLLTTRLCPWLIEGFQHIEVSRRADRLAHAWLLAGPIGIGKLNLAMVLAARLLDPEQHQEPLALTSEEASRLWSFSPSAVNHHPDLHWIVPAEDRHSISIDQVRAAGEQLALKSLHGGAKVVVIAPAEVMTTAAANALLKTLEEPTADTFLLLVSHQPGRLPATIRSRCQTLRVRRPDPDVALRWLGSGPQETAALEFAGGSPLLALELIKDRKNQLISNIRQTLTALSKGKADPLTVAGTWASQDPALALTWLAAQLQGAIRARMAPEHSNRVTDPDVERLHNEWRAMTIPVLFERLSSAEQLLQKIAGGINLELGLGALLYGLTPGGRAQSNRLTA